MLNVLGKLVQMLLWDLKNSVRCQDVENAIFLIKEDVYKD